MFDQVLNSFFCFFLDYSLFAFLFNFVFILNFQIFNILFFVKKSAASEGFNSRLDSIMPCKPLALDKMVDFLAGEDEYWCRIVNDPRLWGDKKLACNMLAIDIR
jgi:hypothetical protein